jgi:hypothetical protein
MCGAAPLQRGVDYGINEVSHESLPIAP